jgi:hypothetical protein
MTSLRAVIIGLLAVLAIHRGADGSAAAFDTLRSITTLPMSERRARAIEIPGTGVFQAIDVAGQVEIAIPGRNLRHLACAREA